MNFPSEWLLLDWLNLGAGLFFAFLIGLSLVPRAGGQADRPFRPGPRRRVRRGDGRHVPGRLPALRTAAPGAALPRPVAAAPDAGAVRPPAGGQPVAAGGRPRQAARGRRHRLLRHRLLRPAGIRRDGIAAVAVAVFYYGAFSSAPRKADWLPRSVVAGVLLGAAVLGRRAALRDAGDGGPGTAGRQPDAVRRACVLGSLGFIGWAAVGLVAAWLCVRLLGPGSRFGAAAAATFLALQTAALVVFNVCELPVRPTTDLQFVHRFLEGHRDERRPAADHSTAPSARRPMSG